MTVFDRLAGIADALRDAHQAGDRRRVTELIAQSALAAWFAVPLHELREILAATRPRPRDEPAVHALYVMLGREDVASDAPSDTSGGQLTRMGAEYFGHRLRGAPRAAQRAVANVTLPTASSALFDNSGGWHVFMAVQSGITLALVGDFDRALAEFTHVQAMPSGDLPFLTRDGYVKAAVVHSLFGDRDRARALLTTAAEVPRTSSWAEEGIDAHAALAEAVLAADGSDAVARLDAIPLIGIGEFWPFYVLGVQQVFTRAGRREEGQARVAILSQARLPRVAGEGLPGSVFETTAALGALARGDIAAAMRALDEADQEMPYTRLLQAQALAQAGRHAEAVPILVELRPATEGLRRLEVSRRLVLAAALLSGGEEETAAEHLSWVARVPGGPAPDELALAAPSVRALAAERVPSWPALDADHAAWAHDPGPAVRLTDRERTVLQLLAKGRARQQIADEMFVSLNTVKTHQRLLYRKLGVSSRDEAVAHAARRGWI